MHIPTQSGAAAAEGFSKTATLPHTELWQGDPEAQALQGIFICFILFLIYFIFAVCVCVCVVCV